MIDMPDLAAAARLLGDRTRGRMLTVLMDGQARTATELAIEGGVTPSTASTHLAQLVEAGLVGIARQGRHRYFRIATSEVAAAIEALMCVAPRAASRRVRVGPRNERLRRARICYDHLAGDAAVGLLDRLRECDIVRGSDDVLELTRAGEAWCDGIGIDLARFVTKRRPLCRPCLDWSERRVHLGGALGAAILDRMFGLRYARREASGRVVTLSAHGESFVNDPERLP